MNAIVTEQVTILQRCQQAQRGFHSQIATARSLILGLEAEVSQAQDELAAAKLAAQQEALLDPDLSNDTKRKAAVEKAMADSSEVKTATNLVRIAQRKVADAKIELDKITDQRRAVEFAQTAAGYIIQAHQQEGTADVTRTRQQPEHANGRS